MDAPKFQTQIVSREAERTYGDLTFVVVSELAVGTDDRIYRRFTWTLDGEVVFVKEWQRDEPTTITRIEILKDGRVKPVATVERTADEVISEYVRMGWVG
jgi:hypothetical protein